ncbi:MULTISPECIES: hypothetical protein [unclassified Actinomyces]|uniref:hypothetical protein n=1 Tax=unclassified Actinomyces TaxID=2609248 RepID=UPI000D0334E5|nr:MULTISPECIES: hypothetical protein [unclassified Actinomyces]AVM62027.1 hypothetical protein C3V41_08115 [Actinomyces sp. oral taxon 897]QQO78782.1 hypothetical protein JJJ15_05770 [Actinomyces sp. HMT897]
MSATEANQRWNRTEGVLIAPGTTSEEVAAVLDQERVLARLEWYPATEHLLSLTLLTDAEGRVAVTPPARGGVVAGLGVSELTERLARHFHADAVIGPASFHDLPREATHDAVREPDPATLRAVVVSPLSAYTVPLQSTLLERPLAVVSLPALDRRVVMYTGEGLDLGALGWDEESLPALVLESQDGDLRVRAVTTGDPDDDAVYSWGMRSRYVWGGVEQPGPALRARAEEFLADVTDASAIAAAVPGADAQAAAEALATPGEDGLRAMVEALGLPAWVEAVLSGRLAPDEVPGAVVHEPRGLSNAVGRSVGMMLRDPATPGSAYVRGYVRTVTEMPWLVRLGALAGVGLGGLLINRALRRRARTGELPVGMVVVGSLMVVNSVLEASMASVTRHRELRRRADEEMALVAEELGA